MPRLSLCTLLSCICAIALTSVGAAELPFGGAGTNFAISNAQSTAQFTISVPPTLSGLDVNFAFTPQIVYPATPAYNVTLTAHSVGVTNITDNVYNGAPKGAAVTGSGTGVNSGGSEAASFMLTVGSTATGAWVLNGSLVATAAQPAMVNAHVATLSFPAAVCDNTNLPNELPAEACNLLGVPPKQVRWLPGYNTAAKNGVNCLVTVSFFPTVALSLQTALDINATGKFGGSAVAVYNQFVKVAVNLPAQTYPVLSQLNAPASSPINAVFDMCFCDFDNRKAPCVLHGVDYFPSSIISSCPIYHNPDEGKYKVAIGVVILLVIVFTVAGYFIVDRHYQKVRLGAAAAAASPERVEDGAYARM